MAHFKGHRVKVHEGEVVFDGAVDINEIKRELQNLRSRRKALSDKVEIIERAIKEISVEEAELADVMREAGEKV